MKIISRLLKLPSGITVRQYFNKTERQTSNLVHTNNGVPKITIKPEETHRITIKQKETVQSMPPVKEVTGADILTEQNKALMTNPDTRISSRLTIKDKGGRNPLYSEFDRLMNSGRLNLEKAQEIERLFFENTGIKLYCPSNSVEGAFSSSVIRIMESVSDGTFPKEIKHILIGHGVGSSLTPRGWQMSGTSVKDGKVIEIYDFINNLKLPKNEPVLVLCCEDGIKSVTNKPGIGMKVDLGLSNLGEFDSRYHTLMGPGKIVRSGENKICGHFTLIDKNKGGGLVYYA